MGDGVTIYQDKFPVLCMYHIDFRKGVLVYPYNKDGLRASQKGVDTRQLSLLSPLIFLQDGVFSC